MFFGTSLSAPIILLLCHSLVRSVQYAAKIRFSYFDFVRFDFEIFVIEMYSLICNLIFRFSNWISDFRFLTSDFRFLISDF